MAYQRFVLGIESSCDETAAAVVSGTHVLSNVIASQHDLHAEYQGVVPEIASRAHAQRIIPIITRALVEANLSLANIDAIAVGNRPGLIGSLLVGVSAAKALAWSRNIPITPVDHVHAHLFAGCMQPNQIAHHQSMTTLAPSMPALGLVISGGHTSIYFLKSLLTPERIGSTIDDAIGEAYDKAASILGLTFPGGPALDKLAQLGNENVLDLPISRIDPSSLDFSFSGLKTAVLYAWNGPPAHPRKPPLPPSKDRPPHQRPSKEDLAASFQKAASKVIILKLTRALDHAKARGHNIKSLLVGGGVSANSRLRAELASFARLHNLNLRIPPLSLCLDNAAMIAGLGYHILESHNWQPPHATFSAVPTTAI